MEQGVYIFENSDDFLKVMEDLGKEYKQNNLISLTKEMLSMEDIRKEINFLNECEMNAFVGYHTSSIIKINITFNESNYAITYLFKGKSFLYHKMHLYLREKEWKMVWRKYVFYWTIYLQEYRSRFLMFTSGMGW